MSLFGIKKKEDKNKIAPSSKISIPAVVNSKAGLTSNDIIRPHITEKSSQLSARGVYTFQVSPKANKNSVSRAVRILYKVMPTSVAMINIPAKKVFVRGRIGKVSGMRKAIVTLKKGDKIDFV